MTHDTIPPELEEELRRRPAEMQQRLRTVWTLLDDDEVAGVVGDAGAWSELSARLPATQRGGDRAPVSSRRVRRRLAAPIAVLALLVLGVWAWRLPVVESVPYGAMLTVELPDGTTVQLDSGSRLAYRRSFAALPGIPSDVRRVRLEGEAYFHVRKDGRPFVVETRGARVEVLGTRFDVRSHPTDAATRVVLEEGRVRVTSSAGRSVLLSTPGEGTRTDGEAMTLEHIDLRRALVWRDGGYAAAGRPLSDVLDDLERKYGIEIHVLGDLELDRRVWLFYHQHTEVVAVIHDLCLSEGCTYRRTDDGFALSGGASRE